jgi:hypothetical protein
MSSLRKGGSHAVVVDFVLAIAIFDTIKMITSIMIVDSTAIYGCNRYLLATPICCGVPNSVKAFTDWSFSS